jgi:endonuclease/exonuclease/phosphatase family metal-dependent hydrolase
MKIRKVFIVVAAFVMCLALISNASAQHREVTLKVMTRNMDAGTDLNYVAAATAGNFEAAVVNTVLEVVNSKIPERATLLAAEIAQAQPDLIALQEVTTWKIEGQFPVHYNQLRLLMESLRALGQNYRVAVVQELTNIQIPGVVTFIDHNAILVRSELMPNLLGFEAHKYENSMIFPTPAGNVEVLGGWMAAEIKIGNSRFKFVNTHLESANQAIPETFLLQLSQAKQLVEDLKGVNLPIILAGDFNSDAEPTKLYPSDATASYGYISRSGYIDAWERLHRRDHGYTWPLFGEDFMAGMTVEPLERIDLIFSNGPKALSITRTGMEPVEHLYASDHAGVVAEFSLRSYR